MRVKIKFPNQKAIKELEIPVRIGDINYGGHLGNDSILSIIHEARMQALAGLGFTELQTGGHGLIMADVMIAYRGEAFYGDMLQVSIFADEVTDRTFDLLYRVQCVREGRTDEIANAKTGMVCFDYQDRKVTTMSEKLKTWLVGD